MQFSLDKEHKNGHSFIVGGGRIIAAIAIIAGTLLIIRVRLKIDIFEIDVFAAAPGADSRCRFLVAFFPVSG